MARWTPSGAGGTAGQTCQACAPPPVALAHGPSLALAPPADAQVYGVDVASSSFLSVLPFVATVLATNAAGWIADGLINNKVGSRRSRGIRGAPPVYFGLVWAEPLAA